MTSLALYRRLYYYVQLRLNSQFRYFLPMESVILENRHCRMQNTDKDQLSGNHKAGQRLCVCIVDSCLKFGILSIIRTI